MTTRRFTPTSVDDLKAERYDAFWTHRRAYLPVGWRAYQVQRIARDLRVTRELEEATR